MAPAFRGVAEPLSQAGFDRVVNLLGAKPAALWAVVSVETSGCGFLPDRRPKILFERHIFHKETAGSFDDRAPDLSDAVAGEYGVSGANQYDRLNRAVELNRPAALRSASWGLGQVMGFNATAAGFADVEEMVTTMMQSEDAHLLAVGAFVKGLGLHTALQNQEWDRFAKAYNGPKYQDNNYAGKLGDFFSAYSTGPAPDLIVRSAQVFLTFLAAEPGTIDGRLGQRTKDALARASVPVTIDAVTLDLLRTKVSKLP